MEKIKELIARILYGLLFTVVIPLLLIIWAGQTDNVVNLQVPHGKSIGYILVLSGVILVIAGMWYLWTYGKGLPMNAFPPLKYVSNGIYSITKHPIYSGAVIISFGLSIIAVSDSGFWLVSPVFTLMIVAYVVGFENERTNIVFGPQNYRPFLSPPLADNSSPTVNERISSFFLVYIPWALIYETFIYLGVPKDAIFTNLSLEVRWPVWEFTEIFYSFAYLFVLLIPLVIKTRKELRSFIFDLWFATALVGFIYIICPFAVKQRDFIPQTFFGDFILWERSMDGETCALPSFHVIWAFMAAGYFSGSMRAFKWVWYTLAILISASCITTGNHSIPDVAAGFITFLIIIYRINIWNRIRSFSERLANSWKEWRWGPVRIINHGFYGGAAGFTGTLVACCFLGRYSFSAVIIMLFVIIGAGLWAQFIEGSPKLQRPYGYYGGVIGAIVASVLLSLIFSIDIFVLMASFAMAGPWIQSIGRLRCLVQGCCHGKPAGENTGIHFTHPYSRVNKISGLRGVALHPTQLYSIFSNLVTGLILIRLYRIGMPAVFITGIYFIMNGLGRFVEESFRGEAQTPYLAGMRIYQWIALLNIMAGTFFTTIPHAKPLSFEFNTASVLMAILTGILVTIASGVDFPESNRRFARLTSN